MIWGSVDYSRLYCGVTPWVRFVSHSSPRPLFVLDQEGTVSRTTSKPRLFQETVPSWSLVNDLGPKDEVE